jgi:hypothetical protein
MEDKNTEHHGTSAREMVINHDGNLLLTSENAGTLSLWALPEFELMYRVQHEEFVRDLAFSPDSQRFYDVRGTICNIWNPMCSCAGETTIRETCRRQAVGYARGGGRGVISKEWGVVCRKEGVRVVRRAEFKRGGR